jgi:hypothetical protein
MGRMAPLAVIEHCDASKHACWGLLVRLKALEVAQRSLAGVEETLGHRVVPAIARPAHTGLQPMWGQELAIALAPLLTATAGRHNEPRGRPPLADRHGAGLGPPRRPPMAGHRPPTTAREPQSSTPARYSQPSPVGREVRSPT